MNLTDVIRTVRRITLSCEACGDPRPITHTMVVRDHEGTLTASRLCTPCGEWALAAKRATTHHD